MANLETQYATDRNLRSRQRLWDHASPPFDLTGWVLDLLAVPSGGTVLDVGCGNGRYLGPIRERGGAVVGCDRSAGMLLGVRDDVPVLVGDVTELPFATAAFDRVLAAQMLYHVEDRPAAVLELRRVLAGGGTCVAVTNGAAHVESIWILVEQAIRRRDPGWRVGDRHIRKTFSLENGVAQLRHAFDEVELVRPARANTVTVRDPDVVADYVASVADLYETESCPWSEVVDEVRSEVRSIIERDGIFASASDAGALICR